MKKIAVIGCGALGQTFIRGLVQKLPNLYEITGIFAFERDQVKQMAEEIGCQACQNFEELMATQPDYLVEIAGIPAVKEYGEAALRRRCHLVVVSIGALADSALKNRLEKAACEVGRKVYVVSGAVGGLDLMQAAACMGLDEVSIENVKAPASLNGAPYLEGRLLSEEQEEIVFEGSVQQAISGFPKNVNVAVTTSLASEYPCTKVIVKSVPGLKENQHIITLKNKSLNARLTICSTPDPANPKSSVSAAWSVVALMKNLASPICFY